MPDGSILISSHCGNRSSSTAETSSERHQTVGVSRRTDPDTSNELGRCRPQNMRHISMSQLLASSRFNRERASSRVKNAVWTLALSALLGCAGVLAMAQTAPAALEAELADYIEMPRTTSSDGRSQAARVNVLIEEPGSGAVVRRRTRGTALHHRQDHSAGSHVHQLQRVRRRPRAVSKVRPGRRICQWADGLRLRSGLPTQRRVLHAPSGKPGD